MVGSEYPNRKQAIATGAKYYIERPCIYGHHGPRLTSNGNCCQCAREGQKLPPAERLAKLIERIKAEAAS